MIEPVFSHRAPAPGGIYSQGLKVDGWLFTAGVGPIDPVSGAVVGSTIEEQTRQVLKNLEAILEAGGCRFRDVVKASVFLQNLQRDFAGFNQTYQEFFQPPYPVRTTVGADLKDILVEIDLIARIPHNG
ncbi:MAG: Rid family detoxifying hydrolase [Firmicutes bacterium]|nr:Rid family detoxifying hydrolase [Bacillota bacterium]